MNSRKFCPKSSGENSDLAASGPGAGNRNWNRNRPASFMGDQQFICDQQRLISASLACDGFKNCQGKCNSLISFLSSDWPPQMGGRCVVELSGPTTAKAGTVAAKPPKGRETQQVAALYRSHQLLDLPVRFGALNGVGCCC